MRLKKPTMWLAPNELPSLSRTARMNWYIQMEASTANFLRDNASSFTGRAVGPTMSHSEFTPIASGG